VGRQSEEGLGGELRQERGRAEGFLRLQSEGELTPRHRNHGRVARREKRSASGEAIGEASPSLVCPPFVRRRILNVREHHHS